MFEEGGFPGGGGGAEVGLDWDREFSPLAVPAASLRGTLGTGTSSGSPLCRARRLFLLHSSWQSWWWGRLDKTREQQGTVKSFSTNRIQFKCRFFYRLFVLSRNRSGSGHFLPDPKPASSDQPRESCAASASTTACLLLSSS